MGENTYNTDHGSFEIKRSNVKDATKALRAWMKKQDLLAWMTKTASRSKAGADLDTLLNSLGFELAWTEKGRVIDLFLNGSYFGETQMQALKVLAPFVTDDSFLVFYGGGTGGCWSVQFNKDKKTGVVALGTEDIVPVTKGDLVALVEAVQAKSVKLALRLSKKYGLAPVVEDDRASA
jgi:hypothetical protein